MSLKTPAGLLSFPNLFVAKPPVAGAAPRFSITLIFDEAAQKTPEYQALRLAVKEAIAGEWGDAKAKDPAFLKKLRSPFRDAAEKDYAGYGPGKVFISPWTKNKPGLVDVNRQDILDPNDVWAGQIARATVVPFAYAQQGNMGVSFSLNNVQILKADMPRLDGRKDAKSDFDDDTSGGGAAADDDIPF